MAQIISSLSRENLSALSTGATGEAVGGAVAVALTILGLSNVAPLVTASVAAVVIGGTLLVTGVAVGARIDRLAPLQNRERVELASGMSAEFVAGISGIALGILALWGVYPVVLLATTPIVFGGGLVSGSAALSRMNRMTEPRAPSESPQRSAVRSARYAVRAAAMAQALVGLIATVLGILALVGQKPLTFSLVALLIIGAALLLSGAALSGKMLTLTHR
jgi:hypothetical protein